MIDAPLIVLKFGGSVLRDEASLGGAVHEVYRWRRDGWRVVAVVSALAGRTDELLARANRLGLGAGSHARAEMAAGGERESAALLAALLERAGVPCACLPAGLRARGPATDAWPTGVATAALREALSGPGVVVSPGYIARDRRGRTVLLGRGGSDLTALCLAHALGATRCVLVKDVDGLYDSDPRTAGGAARRYATATWRDALATDGSIIQHKAIRFARRHRLEFELGALNAVAWTRIGHGPSIAGERPGAAAPLRVALLGHGNVGGGVARLLADDPARFTLVGVAVRAARPLGASAPVFDDPVALAGAEVDVVVEVMGGTDAAERAVAAALSRGTAVVTANKDLLAARGPALFDLARRRGARLLAGAAVGGAVPVLEALARDGGSPLVSLRGVLNGTANFVLERCEQGHTLEAALAEARARGLAEADASRDLDGRDAAAKLCTAALMAGGPRVHEGDVACEPIAGPGLQPGFRQVASLERAGDGWRARVALERPDDGSLLRLARGEENVVVLERADGSRECLHGSGAGRWPTAEAVLGDLLELARGRALLAAATPPCYAAATRGD